MGFLSRLFGKDDTGDRNAMKRRAEARRRATAEEPATKPRRPATFGKGGTKREQVKPKKS